MFKIIFLKSNTSIITLIRLIYYFHKLVNNKKDKLVTITFLVSKD